MLCPPLLSGLSVCISCHATTEVHWATTKCKYTHAIAIVHTKPRSLSRRVETLCVYIMSIYKTLYIEMRVSSPQPFLMCVFFSFKSRFV